MGKEITLPLGLNIADADSIGDYSLVSGRTYDVTNITTMDIRNVLGEDNNDVGLLCTSPNINKWAAFRPYPLDKAYTEGATKYGYTYEAATMQLVYHAVNDGYRMGDFAGYNHNAVKPAPNLPATSVRYSKNDDEVSAEFILGDFGPKDYLPFCDYMHLIEGTGWLLSVSEYNERYIGGVITTPVNGKYTIVTNLTLDYNNPTRGITRYPDEGSPTVRDITTTISLWFGEFVDEDNIGSEGVTQFVWQQTGEIANEFDIVLRKMWLYYYRGTGKFNSSPNDRDIRVRLTDQVVSGTDVTITLFWSLTDWDGNNITAGGLGDSIEVYWSPNSDGSNPTPITTIDEGDISFIGEGDISFTVSTNTLSAGQNMYIFFNRVSVI